MLKHLECQVRSLHHGVSHSTPSKNEDVQLLENAYTSFNIHTAEPEQTEQTGSDIVKDIVTEGAIKLGTKDTIERWWKRRDLVRATTETW